MRIAFILKDLQYSQASMMLTHQINNFPWTVEFLAFYEEKSAVFQKPQFATLPVYYTRHMLDGHLICTSMSQAEYIRDIPTKAKKYYYMQDLDWLRYWGRDYFHTKSVYDSINLITPSETYAKEVKNFCGKDSIIIPNFDLNKFIEELK